MYAIDVECLLRAHAYRLQVPIDGECLLTLASTDADFYCGLFLLWPVSIFLRRLLISRSVVVRIDEIHPFTLSTSQQNFVLFGSPGFRRFDRLTKFTRFTVLLFCRVARGTHKIHSCYYPILTIARILSTLSFYGGSIPCGTFPPFLAFLLVYHQLIFESLEKIAPRTAVLESAMIATKSRVTTTSIGSVSFLVFLIHSLFRNRQISQQLLINNSFCLSHPSAGNLKRPQDFPKPWLLRRERNTSHYSSATLISSA